MNIKIAEYTVRESEMTIVLEAIKSFVAAINSNEPDTYYEAYQHSGTFDFVHIMKFTDKEAEKNHSEAAYTKEFVKILYPRCIEDPVFTELHQVK